MPLKLSSTQQIILALVLGILGGLLANYTDTGHWVLSWIAPFGVIFLKLLKLVALPLIIISLLSGFSQLKGLSDLSKLGGKTALTYLSTTIFAVSLGLVLSNLINPGSWITEATRMELTAGFMPPTHSDVATPPLDFLVNMIPENFLATASDNRNMLPIIITILLLSIALLHTDEKRRNRLAVLFADLNELIMQLVGLIMRFAPVGVFSLMMTVVVNAPSTDLLLALLGYSLTVITGLGMLTFIFYPLLVRFFKKMPVKVFLKGILPAQLVAFSTSSSAAVLPKTMDCVQNNLGVSPVTAGFVLPMGATLNMDGTAFYISCAAVFLASAFGMEMSFLTQLSIVFTVTMASIGTAAVPGAGIVMLTIVMEQVGIPMSGLALILAVDRPLDMLRTVTNVTSDATVALIVE